MDKSDDRAANVNFDNIVVPNVDFSFITDELAVVLILSLSKGNRLFFPVADDDEGSVGCFTLKENVRGGDTTWLLSLALSDFMVSADKTISDESCCLSLFSVFEVSGSVLNEKAEE